jgi:predicted nucleic acid-binding protein
MRYDLLRGAVLTRQGVPETSVREIAAFLRASASFAAAPAQPPPVRIRDPDDAVILSEALAVRADVLVTGDKDLLEAGEVPGISILDPRGFWQFVRGKAT